MSGRVCFSNTNECIGYLSAVGMNHQDQRQLKEEKFTWAYGSRGIRTFDGGCEAWRLEREAELTS